MTGSDLYFVGTDDTDAERLAEAYPEPTEEELVPSGWTVTPGDAWIERADLGAGVSTFYPAGSAIPPALAGLPRHATPPSPKAAAPPKTGRATAR